MITLEQASGAVNYASGITALSLDLLAWPGELSGNVHLPIAYTSNVYKTAATWNMSAPTGALGLGWHMGFELIVANPQYDSSQSNTQYYLLSGGNSTPLVCTGSSGDQITFATENYAFWKITYDTARELWQIIKEDGISYYFGDINSGRETVQWSIAWDNWLGSSSQTQGQTPFATVWNLSQVVDMWGNTSTYTYENIFQYVGPAPTGSATRAAYTQASYLVKITGITGDMAVFHYEEKDPSEYQYPHTNPPPPNAYQDRYETRYLSSVDYISSTGQRLFTSNLLYDNGQGGTAFLGSGDLTKRLLTGIRCTWPGGESLPGPRFTYYGQDPLDGVSATNLYNAATHALYGAMKAVMVPEGGTVTYHYSEYDLGLSDRQATVTIPVKTGYAFSQPRFSFADNFTVVTWYGEQAGGANPIMQVTAYTWDGRWLSATLDAIPLSSPTVYNQIPILTQDNFFGIVSGQRVYLYHCNFNQAGQWISPAAGNPSVPYFTTAIPTSETIQFVGGDGFAAVLGTTDGQLYRYHWNGRNWVDDGAITLSTGGGVSLFAATGSFNYLFTSGAAASGGDMYLTLFYLDETGAWQSNAFTRPRLVSNLSQLTLQSGQSFVVLTETSALASLQLVQYRVFWWNKNYSSLDVFPLGGFSFSSGQTPYRAVIHASDIALNQRLHRFNGVQWLTQDIGQINSPSSSTLSSISYGVDQVLRIIQTGTSAYTYDLVNYDPNTQTWSVPGGMSATGSTSQVACRAAITWNQPSNYVIFNSKVYYQQPDGLWASQLTIPDTLSGDDLASLQLIGSDYIIYQSGGDTKIYTLQNGTVTNAGAPPITLPDQKMLVSASMPNSLTGQNAFATYTDAYGTPSSILTLYRVVNQQVKDLQAGYCVTGILAYNGYQSVITGYKYTASNATVDLTGLIPYFNQVTIIPGSELPSFTTYGTTENYFFNGLTLNESPLEPYPSDPAYTNATGYYTRMKGLLYTNRIKDSADILKSSTNYYWMVYQKTLGLSGVGLYTRLTKEVPMLDNIAGQIINSYSPDTGLVKETSTRNYNSAGVEELTVQQYKYFWEVYDPTRSLNLLVPIIQTTARTQQPAQSIDVITGITVTTWKSTWGYGSGAWGPWQTFSALNASATFTEWNGGDSDPAWLLTSAALSRTATGLVTLMTDVNGVYSFTLFDTSQWYSTAQFVNASATNGEANYYGFEPYENLQGWSWTNPNSSLTANITTIDYHTGTQSLQLLPYPQQQYGPINVFQPSDQTRSYVFSCWAKAEGNFDPLQGAARWQLAVYRGDNNQQVGSTLKLDILNTNNAWAYLQKTVDLPVLRASGNVPNTVSLYVIISAFNQNSSNYCLVDNLRFSAVNGSFGAIVYQPDNWLVTATVGNNGETNRSLFDDCCRCIAQIGPGEQVKWLVEPSYSRDLTSSDQFLQDFPNSILLLQTTSDSAYYDFHDGNTSNWTFTGGTWTIANGALNYVPSVPPPTDQLGGTATLNLFAFTNFAARIICNTQISGTAGIGNGDVFVYWDGTASRWVLARKQTDGTLITEMQSNAQGFGKSWVFAIIEGFVMFYVEGVQLFSYTYVMNSLLPNVGKPVLTLKQAGSFDDLLILNDPQLSVSLQDGAGNTLQSISYKGQVSSDGSPIYMANGAGVLIDSLGRPAYDRNALNAPLQLAPPSGSGLTAAELLEGNQDTYLVDVQGQHLSVQEYIDGEGGIYDYTLSQYESSPLSRVTANIMPRETSSDPANFTVSYRYLTNTSSGPGSVMNDLLPAGSDNRYYLNQTTDQNGVNRYSLIDQSGRIVALRTVMADNTYNTTFFFYDVSGCLTLANQPNYYAPPGGSTNTNWQESQTFDFLNRLTSRTTPDTHLTQYLYDNAGRLRFQMTAEGKTQTPQRIRYFKYDALSRITERGYIQDNSYQWGSAQLTGMVNNQAFPNVAQQSSPYYASGSWYQKSIYDANPAQADVPNLLGRLYQTQTNYDVPGIETETFAYDAEGRVTTQTSNIANYDSGTYTTNYTYNNLDNVTSIIYPRLPGGSEFKVAYYYDRLGRVASVGDVVEGSPVIDPSHPADAGEKYYAAYTYNELGSIATESLNNGKGNAPGTTNPNSFMRTYAYVPQGWLTNIDDPYFNENLDYYQDAGTKYYNGNIAGISLALKPGKGACPPQDYDYDFTYDNLNRMITAQNSLNDAWTMKLGAGGQTTYDANGNIINLQQGATKTTYYYAPSGQNPNNNQVNHLSSTASSNLSFDAVTTSPACSSGWCWGANNGGPSTSEVVTDAQKGKVLKLGGGSLGHYEFLRLQTYLDPSGVYTLSYQLKTDADFSSGVGEVGWLVRLYTPANEIVAIMVSAITSTSSAWVAKTATINIPALISSLGLNEQVTYVTLECMNYLRPAGSSGTGPAVYLDDPSITIQTTLNTAAYIYNQDGNVTSAPAQSLTALGYNSVTGLPESLTLPDQISQIFTQNSADLRSLELQRDSSQSTLGSARTLRGLSGRPLVRIDTVGQAPVQTTCYVHGVDGMLASNRNGATSYFVRDHLGSPCALVDGDTGLVEGNYNYLPFGGLMRVVEGGDTVYRFTQQEYDENSGMYNYNARLYNPPLLRFLSPDQISSLTSPYAYVGNNPISRTDPSGNIMIPEYQHESTPFPSPSEIADSIINAIFRMRRNFGELTQIPRQDMSLAEWLYNAPAWIYLPYTKVSPTELAATGYHLVLLPGLSFVSQGLQDAYTFATSPLTIFKTIKSVMYATVYNPMPNGQLHLLSMFAKKMILRTGFYTAKAYISPVLDWLKGLPKLPGELSNTNQEARDFRSDLKSDPWIKNSYRHGYWMCRYTQKWGENFALAIGYAHEYAHLDLTIEGPYDSVIDKINNLRGAKLGLTPGGDCGVLVNSTGSNAALAWAKNYVQHPITGFHQPTLFNLQRPLDMLWQDYKQLPEFNSYDLGALARLNITLPDK